MGGLSASRENQNAEVEDLARRATKHRLKLENSNLMELQQASTNYWLLLQAAFSLFGRTEKKGRYALLRPMREATSRYE